MTANRLATETSPYLLQHADNPVHWHPWGDEALAAAREANKPILLSIGYSACHWCHVMAHESFEDADVAAVMNELFVNVKVDREERPDLDQIYQLAHQILTQRPGGWPLTMFLTPEAHVPFFGGTYFPPAPRHGLPSFRDMLQRVAVFYREHNDEIERQSDAIVDVFRSTDPAPSTGTDLDATPLGAARAALLADFDQQHGGFGDAPKFPASTGLEYLLRLWRASAPGDDPDLQALYMVTRTLHAMAAGGLYDQIGGGFFRYSVDQRWEIPHFEKMLYDNGPLLALYAAAHKATGERFFWRVANETADWVLREMRAPGGAFFATLDADSEGHEGKFYVWAESEVEALLDQDEYQVVRAHYGLDQAPNFEGAWHLCIKQALDDEAVRGGRDERDTEALISRARAKLFAAREPRVRPARDEKILTGWNGQMIRALAIAARHLERPDLAEAAAEALDFICRELYRDGRLLAVYKDERARFPAYLDDYAFLLDGVLELIQERWDRSHLEFAIELADTLLTRFYDQRDGGFFFTADDHEALLHRMKPLSDNATPAGNGVAAKALGRLGTLLGETRYLDAVTATLQAAWEPLERYPHAHASLLIALEETLDPTQWIVIRADGDAAREWHRAATGQYAPRRMCVVIPTTETGLPAALAERAPRGDAVAYLCNGTSCQPPIEDPGLLRKELDE